MKMEIRERLQFLEAALEDVMKKYNGAKVNEQTLDEAKNAVIRVMIDHDMTVRESKNISDMFEPHVWLDYSEDSVHPVMVVSFREKKPNVDS